MGKKKHAGEYNDYLDGEKLRDNAEIRTSLNGPSSATSGKEISPPAPTSGQNGLHTGSSKRPSKAPTNKPQLTHFLCLPLVTDTSRPQLQAGLQKFKQDLARHTNVSEKAVRPLGSLHLTLGIMSLDGQSLQAAKDHLESLHLHRILRDITHLAVAQDAAEDGTIAENLNAANLPETEFLSVDLEGLATMQEPGRTSVLYAKPVDGKGRLVPFASAIRDAFMGEGCLVEDSRALRLHATVVNTIYAKPRGREKRVKHTLKHVEHKISPHYHEPDPNEHTTHTEHNQAHNLPANNSWTRFDARSLIEEYKDFIWAQDVRIDRVQICKMGAKKVWSGGTEGVGEVLDERYEVVCERGVFE